MKRIVLILIAVLFLTPMAYAQHPGTWGNNAVLVNGASVPTSKTVVGTNSSGQIVDATTAAGSFTCLPLGGLNTCQYAAAVLNNGVITLPTATSGWPLRCEIETGDDADSAYFTVTSGGTASPISSSAGIVFNAATASKVQVGAASPANPLIITNASGGTLNIWAACKYK